MAARKSFRLAVVVICFLSVIGLAGTPDNVAQAADCCDNAASICDAICPCGTRGYVCSSGTCKGACFCEICPV